MEKEVLKCAALAEEGSNLRSYRSNTTFTMLPICPQNNLLYFFQYKTIILSVHYRPLWYLPKNISVFAHHSPQCVGFIYFPQLCSHWLVEEGSNLRSYRSSTTLTVLPICPLSRLLLVSIRSYPYLWYPPCYFFLQGLYYLATFSMLVREMYPLHHVKELIVKSFSL